MLVLKHVLLKFDLERRVGTTYYRVYGGIAMLLELCAGFWKVISHCYVVSSFQNLGTSFNNNNNNNRPFVNPNLPSYYLSK